MLFDELKLWNDTVNYCREFYTPNNTNFIHYETLYNEMVYIKCKLLSANNFENEMV
jgi:hypothetical protein